jgi:hypothetical protein
MGCIPSPRFMCTYSYNPSVKVARMRTRQWDPVDSGLVLLRLQDGQSRLFRLVLRTFLVGYNVPSEDKRRFRLWCDENNPSACVGKQTGVPSLGRMSSHDQRWTYRMVLPEKAVGRKWSAYEPVTSPSVTGESFQTRCVARVSRITPTLYVLYMCTFCNYYPGYVKGHQRSACCLTPTALFVSSLYMRHLLAPKNLRSIVPMPTYYYSPAFWWVLTDNSPTCGAFVAHLAWIKCCPPRMLDLTLTLTFLLRSFKSTANCRKSPAFAAFASWWCAKKSCLWFRLLLARCPRIPCPCFGVHHIIWLSRRDDWLRI